MSGRATELVEALRRATTDAQVDTGDAVSEARRATYPGASDLAVMVHPRSTAEVSACIHVAAAHDAHVQPISRGRNWGYGSRRPRPGVQVAMMLDRMDRISAIDGALGAVTLEPGVDFASLQRALDEASAELVLPGPGSTADASVIAHALQRGIAQGPDGERGGQLVDLEVVLADGSVIDTGVGGRAAPYYRGTRGPDVTGLFLQSALGVVTRATIWLAERPLFRQGVEARFALEAGLVEAMETMRALCRRGLLRAGFTVADRDRQLANAWADGATDRALVAWRIETAIAGADIHELMAVQASVTTALATAGAEITLHRINEPDVFFGRLGHPSPALAYRGLGARPAGTLDPDRDGVGLIWGNAIVPMRGIDALRVGELLRPWSRWLTPIGVGFQGASARALHAIFACAWDRNDDAAEIAAPAAWLAAMHALGDAGYPPYRVPRGYEHVLPAPPGRTAVSSLTHALDPHGRFG